MTDPAKAKEMFVAPTIGSALFQAFCRAFFLCYCPLTVEGRDHLPASPFIICSNHTSHIDSAVLMTASGLPFSTFALLGARDYFFDSWRVGFLVSRFMNVIPIDRHPQHESLRRSLAMCDQFLKRTRGNLILYPEGTRSSSGEIQTFKKGAGLFAVELGVSVVPAYIEGARAVLAKGKFVPRLGTVAIRFGEAIRFDQTPSDHLRRRVLRKAAIELLEQRIRGLSHKPRAEDLAGLPEERQRMTISVAATAKRGRRENGHGLSRM
jgi:1-acyl-sn-glycerol-3-phosphate acyltransferase